MWRRVFKSCVLKLLLHLIASSLSEEENPRVRILCILILLNIHYSVLVKAVAIITAITANNYSIKFTQTGTCSGYKGGHWRSFLFWEYAYLTFQIIISLYASRLLKSLF